MMNKAYNSNNNNNSNRIKWTKYMNNNRITHINHSSRCQHW